MFSLLELLGPFLLTNWPFFVIALILGLLGEVSKNIVLNGGNYEIKKWSFRWFYTRTLPMHPVIAGALLGIILAPLAPQFVGVKVIGSILYFAGSGVMSTWFYHAFKAVSPELLLWFKNKLHG